MDRLKAKQAVVDEILNYARKGSADGMRAAYAPKPPVEDEAPMEESDDKAEDIAEVLADPTVLQLLGIQDE